MAPKSGDSGMGRRIAARRIERGLSQAALSRRTGIDPSYVSRIETGNVHPTVRTALRIAEALRMSLEDLVGPSPPDRRPQPCLVSASGRCMLDLVDPGVGAGQRGECEFYSPQQIRLLKKFAGVLRRGSPDLLKALDTLLGEIVERET